jgi:hypothetical protein
MSSETIDQILRMIEDSANSRPSAIEFEMAYQLRVAIDRIKFAIRHMEKFGQQSDQLREAGLQLLDALEQLEAVDRRFQNRARGRAICAAARVAENGTSVRATPPNGSPR